MAARNEVEGLVARGKFTSAARRLGETRKQDPLFVLSAAQMGRLAEGLLREQHVQPAMKVLAIGCDAYPAYAARWRIRMASIELTAHRDPIKAIEQLRLIDKDSLDSKLRQQYIRVAEEAKRIAGI